MKENEIGTMIVNAAIQIHRDLGPGLLESVYETILARRLEKEGLSARRQVPVSIQYDGEIFDEGFRADLFVEGKLIVELKSVETIHSVHKKQLLTYLRLTDSKVGYLLNFGEELMKHGIYRVINGRLDSP